MRLWDIIFIDVFFEKKINNPIKNPLIILGGFLITSEAYIPLKDIIENTFGRKVYLVKISRSEWIQTNSSSGWSKILNKFHGVVLRALKETKANNVDLIGHSSGGVMLRLYLSNDSFNGYIYDGNSFTSNLITLGSPHQAIRATKLRKFVDEKYPANFFENINYVSVGGKVEIHSRQASLVTKLLAKVSYNSISGDRNENGDGLVPLSSSLLKGSQKIILSETAHGGIFGKKWYGTPEKVVEWWDQINWKENQ